MLRTPQPKQNDPRKQRLLVYKVGVSLFIFLVAFILGLFAYIWSFSGDIEPPDVSDLDLNYLPVQDDENAFVVFRELLPQLEMTEAEKSFIHEFLNGEEVEQQKLRAVLERYEYPLMQMAEGIRRSRCVFPEITSVNDLASDITGMLDVAKLYQAQAYSAQEDGNVGLAIEAAGNLLFLGEAISEEPQSLIQYLVGEAISALAADAMEQLLLSEQVDPFLLLNLESNLWRKAQRSESYRRAMKAEFQFAMMAVGEATPGLPDELLEEDVTAYFVHHLSPSYLYKPNETKLFFAEYYRNALHNSELPVSEMTFIGDEELRRWARTDSIFPAPNFIGRIFGGLLLTAVEDAAKKKAGRDAGMTALRLMLALRVYKVTAGQ